MASRRKKSTKKAIKQFVESSEPTPASTKTARLNLLIRPDLKEWAHGYAVRKDKSLSSLVNEYFLMLRERERGDCVEQI